MDSRSQANAALADFAKLAGLEQLQLDEQDACYLSFDAVVVCFDLDQRTGDLVLSSVVGAIGRDAHALAREMLGANFAGGGTRGATLGIDADTSGVVLSQRLPLAGLRAALLEQRLQDFVTTAEEWTKRLSAPASPERAADEDTSALPESAIRV